MVSPPIKNPKQILNPNDQILEIQHPLTLPSPQWGEDKGEGRFFNFVLWSFVLVSNFGFRASNLKFFFAFFTQMILQRKTASSRPVLATSSAEKEVVQASWTVIGPNMVRVGFCTGPLLTADIETDTFSAAMAEFKEVLIQDCTADFTVMDLHTH